MTSLKDGRSEPELPEYEAGVIITSAIVFNRRGNIAYVFTDLCFHAI
jgi:hypothetical protein